MESSDRHWDAEERKAGPGRSLSDVHVLDFVALPKAGYGHEANFVNVGFFRADSRVVLRRIGDQAGHGQLLPFAVAAEISRERPFAPARSGGGGCTVQQGG